MPETKTTRGFKVSCLKCGSDDDVRLMLADVETFTCDACSESWTADDVRKMVAEWRRVLAWVDMIDQIID